MPEVLEYFGLEYNVPGIGYRKVRCPFHDDRNPSASVSEDYFRCFACEVHGDAIDLVMEQLGLDFNEALDFIKDL